RLLHSFPTRRSSDLSNGPFSVSRSNWLVSMYPTIKRLIHSPKSCALGDGFPCRIDGEHTGSNSTLTTNRLELVAARTSPNSTRRSEEHTSELQSREN